MTAISGSLQPISTGLQLLLPVAKAGLPYLHLVLSPQRAGLCAMQGFPSKRGVPWVRQTLWHRVWWWDRGIADRPETKLEKCQRPT